MGNVERRSEWVSVGSVETGHIGTAMTIKYMTDMKSEKWRDERDQMDIMIEVPRS